MQQRFFHAVICLMALLGLSGCATSGSTAANSINARLDRQDQQIQTLLSQVGQVEQVLPGQAEVWSQMQTMRQEMNILTGKIDDLQMQTSGQGGGEFAMLQQRVENLEAVVRKMASQLAINVDSLNTPATGTQSPATNYTPSQTTSPTGGTSTTTPSTDTATALYNAGIKAFDERRYKDAVVSFKDFGSFFPQHKLAGNAHFWEGESYFQLKDYTRAVVAYQEVIANFPGSPKLQSSMLKQGISLYNANKKAAGRERLQDLVKRYASSPEAARAKQFLAENK